MRTTEMGAWTPPSGITPGIRRPVLTVPPAADLLTEDAVRRADVVARLRFDRGPLQAEAVLPDRASGLVDDGVLGLASFRQREVEAREGELDPDHLWSKGAQP